MSREDENEDTIPDSDTFHFYPFPFHSSLSGGAAQSDADHQGNTILCIVQLPHLS
jgi:hypothetical protein